LFFNDLKKFYKKFAKVNSFSFIFIGTITAPLSVIFFTKDSPLHLSFFLKIFIAPFTSEFITLLFEDLNNPLSILLPE